MKPLVMETNDPLMETHNHLWKQFLDNKELSMIIIDNLSFMEIIFQQ